MRMAASSALFLAALLLCASAATSSASPSDASNEQGMPRMTDEHLALALRSPDVAFLRFLARFGKNYTSGAEFKRRLAIFRSNAAVAAERQLADPGAVHGITPFSDLTPKEFARKHLGLHAVPVLSGLAKKIAAPLPIPEDVPAEFDWRDKGAVTDVKNQGMCGSCYAFSAVGAVEGAHFLTTGKLESFSEQQIVDCDHQCDPEYHDVCDSGCNGGLMNNVLKYIETAGGLQTSKDYPYKGVGRTCKFDKTKVATTVQNFIQVPVDEKQITASLVKYGPLAVAINAGWMQSYVRGVSCPLICDRAALNHGVLLVGYGVHGFSPARLKFKDFWIIKNSWGTGWGEAGYYRVCSGKDECGVDSMVTAVVAVDGDVASEGAAEGVSEDGVIAQPHSASASGTAAQ